MRTKLRPGHRNRFFATCWVMVEPPRATSPSSASSITSRSASQSMPRWLQNLASSEATTERGSAGEMAPKSIHCRDTGAPVSQRQAISVETGWPAR